ncbi:hypothetical protein [Mycobacterium sp. URHB0044]|jgi:hypothetical protein|uniref:hypothetical protein n=1 Tax=Mycobacterium sp. URHB0044 TaxID=1380386 RepID=UPI000561C8B5|nr:hypothetical protein [Mycobacterium sp. URHB0044]
MTNAYRRLAGILVAGGAVLLAVAPAAGADGYNGAPTVVSGGPVPTMNGVPCVAGHLGTCIGFAQNSPARKVPRATVGHSPTVGR